MAYIQQQQHQQQQQQQAQAGGGDDDQVDGVISANSSYGIQVNDSITTRPTQIVGITVTARSASSSTNVATTVTAGSAHQMDQNTQQQSASQHSGASTNGNTDEEDPNNQSMASIEEEQINQDESIDINNTSGTESSGSIKTPNSYKFPLLKRYYEFGPWIGRNRKAICLGCRLQTSSSQPDRLLKHLNKCNALTEQDKVAVRELMNERTANKRKKPVTLRLKNQDGDSEFYGDEQDSADNLTQSSIPIPAGGLKKLRRDHPDRNSQIDEALTRFIMMCRIPLKAIHSQEFVDFCRSLNPDYHIPSRETITNVLIPGLLNII